MGQTEARGGWSVPEVAQLGVAEPNRLGLSVPSLSPGLTHPPSRLHLHHGFLGIALSVHFDQCVLARMGHKLVSLRPAVLGLVPKFLLKVLLCILQ